MNCWESFYIRIFLQQNTQIDEQKVNDLNQLCTLANVTRWHVMHSDTHPSTQASSAQSKFTINNNSTSMFIFYRHNFYIILNFILFITEYPDCIYGHVNILLIQILS
jgi:hypothetical protein